MVVGGPSHDWPNAKSGDSGEQGSSQRMRTYAEVWQVMDGCGVDGRVIGEPLLKVDLNAQHVFEDRETTGSWLLVHIYSPGRIQAMGCWPSGMAFRLHSFAYLEKVLGSIPRHSSFVPPRTC